MGTTNSLFNVLADIQIPVDTDYGSERAQGHEDGGDGSIGKSDGGCHEGGVPMRFLDPIQGRHRFHAGGGPESFDGFVGGHF